MAALRKIACALALFVATLAPADATNEFFTDYIHSNLYISYCYNYDYTPLSKLLYYQGASELLNEYIVAKVEEGALENKQVYISIGGVVFSGMPSVEMTRSRSNYYFGAHAEPDFEYLLKAVAYFAHPQWESLVYERQEQYEAAAALFNRRMKQYVPDVDISIFKDRRVEVFRADELQIVFVNDSLKVELAGVDITPEDGIGSVRPVKFRDRYIVFGNKYIRVYQDGRCILNRRIPENTYYEEWCHSYESKCYGDWVNVDIYGYPVFSYCYSRNRMYVIPVPERN